jgi:hypothetical protein
MTAANIRRHSTRFLFLQNPDDLLIAEPAAFHSSVPLRNRSYRKLATIQGGTSDGVADQKAWAISDPWRRRGIGRRRQQPAVDGNSDTSATESIPKRLAARRMPGN